MPIILLVFSLSFLIMAGTSNYCQRCKVLGAAVEEKFYADVREKVRHLHLHIEVEIDKLENMPWEKYFQAFKRLSHGCFPELTDLKTEPIEQPKVKTTDIEVHDAALNKNSEESNKNGDTEVHQDSANKHKRFPCGICVATQNGSNDQNGCLERKFVGDHPALEQHVIAAHLKKPVVQCSACKFTTKWADAMAKHIENRHSGKAEAKDTKYTENLRLGIRVATDEATVKEKQDFLDFLAAAERSSRKLITVKRESTDFVKADENTPMKQAKVETQHQQEAPLADPETPTAIPHHCFICKQIFFSRLEKLSAYCAHVTSKHFSPPIFLCAASKQCSFVGRYPAVIAKHQQNAHPTSSRRRSSSSSSLVVGSEHRADFDSLLLRAAGGWLIEPTSESDHMWMQGATRIEVQGMGGIEVSD